MQGAEARGPAGCRGRGSGRTTPDRTRTALAGEPGRERPLPNSENASSASLPRATSPRCWITNAPSSAGAAANVSHVHNGQSCGAALDERQHDRGQAAGQQHRAERGRSAGPRRAGLRDRPGREQDPTQADRQVDQEAAAPVEPERIDWTSTPPISWPPTAARPITIPYADSACARSLPPYRTPMIDRTLGVSSAAAEALDQASGDQHRRGRRGPQSRRAEREQRRARR